MATPLVLEERDTLLNYELLKLCKYGIKTEWESSIELNEDRAWGFYVVSIPFTPIFHCSQEVMEVAVFIYRVSQKRLPFQIKISALKLFI